MPIEIAHYALTLMEGVGQEHYQVLRVIQPGDEDILFDPKDITGTSDPLRFWGEGRKGNELITPAYFLRGSDPRPIIIEDLIRYIDAVGGQIVPTSGESLMFTNQVFFAGEDGQVLSVRYIAPTPPLYHWWAPVGQ